jgi:hypothetical protein
MTVTFLVRLSRYASKWQSASREKSYALYAVNADGELVLAKQSAHTIGQYRSPYPRDRERRWIAEAWIRTIHEALGQTVEPPPWFELPATSQLTLTTWNLTKHYRKTSNPFDFLAVAQLAYPGMLRCCEAPRPSCLLFKNLAAWAEQSWQCLSCGTAIEPYLADTELPIFKMYRRVVANLAQSIELKRLPASGAEPTPETMRGLTIPRPVHATLISHLGKEVIVDRDRAEARRVLAQGNRQGHGIIARGLLAHSCWSASPASTSLGDVRLAGQRRGRLA